MALALAGAGAKLALVSRDAGQLESTAREVRAAGAEAHVFRTDVTDEEQVRQLERDAIARFGAVHILINNAGINVRKNVPVFTLDEWPGALQPSQLSISPH